MEKKGFCIWCFLGSVFFSLSTVIGAIYAPYGKKIGGIESVWEAAMYVPAAVILTVLFYRLLKWLLNREYVMKTEKQKGRIADFFDSHMFACSLALMLVCWLPYLIVLYPGSMPYDGAKQIIMWKGSIRMESTRPIFTTMLLGSLFSIGQLISDNFGVFLNCIFQTLVCAAVYAFLVVKIRKMGASLTVCGFTAGYFALLPVWGMYAQAVIKDTLFPAVFVLYVIYTVELLDALLKKKEKILAKQWIAVFVTGFFVCISRHNGKYTVYVMALILLAAAGARWRRRAAALLLLSVLTFSVYNKAVVYIFDVEATSTRAFFSVPFQQTARYLLLYPEDVTEEEYAAIDEIADADHLAELYKPLISDPVKNTFKKDAEKKDLLNYIKAWVKMFFKHPGVYVEAFLQHCYGYLDPFHHISELGDYQTYLSEEILEEGNLDVFYAQDSRVRENIIQYGKLWMQLFPLNLLSYPGLYTWLTVFCCLLLIKKGRIHQLLVMVIPVLHILVCMVSPVNGYVRYAMPLMAIMPYLITWTIARVKEECAG